MLAISGLAIRPVYPLLFGSYFIILWEVFTQMALADPRTVTTEDFLKNMFSDAIIPAYYRFPQIANILVTSVLVYMCGGQLNIRFSASRPVCGIV